MYLEIYGTTCHWLPIKQQIESLFWGVTAVKYNFSKSRETSVPLDNFANEVKVFIFKIFFINVLNDRFNVRTVNQTGYSGVITSPNFPNNYGNFDLQEYYISVPSNQKVVNHCVTISEAKL